MMNFVGDASKDSSKKTQLYLPPGCQHSNATPNLYLFGFKFLPQISSPLSPNFSKTSRPAGMPPDSEFNWKFKFAGSEATVLSQCGSLT